MIIVGNVQQKDGARDQDDALIRTMLRLNVANQHSCQCGHRHVYEESDWHVVRLDVDANHRPKIEIDEQEKNIVDGSSRRKFSDHACCGVLRVFNLSLRSGR